MSTKKIQVLDYIIKQAENADTVDNKHASDFASATDMSTVQSNISDLQTKVGDSAVSAQISAAISSIDCPVDSVNGKTGAVQLTAEDIGAVPIGGAAVGVGFTTVSGYAEYMAAHPTATLVDFLSEPIDDGIFKASYVIGSDGGKRAYWFTDKYGAMLSLEMDDGLPMLKLHRNSGRDVVNIKRDDYFCMDGESLEMKRVKDGTEEVYLHAPETTDSDTGKLLTVSSAGTLTWADADKELYVTDQTEEFKSWCEAQGQSDLDIHLSWTLEFLQSLSDGMHYVDNSSCNAKFWSVNYRNGCIVFAPSDIYLFTGSDALKLTSDGVLEKYTAYGSALVKSVDPFAAAEFAVKDVSDAYAAWEPTDVSKTPHNYVSTLEDGSYHIALDNGVLRYDVVTVDGIQWIYERSTQQGVAYFSVYCGGAEKISASTAGTIMVDGHNVITDATYPVPTSSDAGKVLMVGDNGVPMWTSVISAEEVSF